MKEHAIPQDITGYKFHIVGNMTLKQFAEVAIGVVVAFFIYKTNLIDFVKYPLVILSCGLGAALAFLPVAERPLDHWFITLFVALYKPTKFFWKKEPHIPDAFLYKPRTGTKKQEIILDLTPQRRQRIGEFLKSVKIPHVLSQDELITKQRSKQLLAIFEDKTLKISPSKTPNSSKKPNLKVRVRSLVGINNEQSDNDSIPAERVIFSSSKDWQAIAQPVVQSAHSASPAKPFTKKGLGISQVATEIKIPKLNKIEIKKNTQKEKQDISQRPKNQLQSTSFSTVVQSAASRQQAVAATTNIDLPFPTKPTQGNKLVGMILTKNNELIDGATITISDEDNQPKTAIKSNALGQFFISSRLADGNYIIDVKKDNFTFQPIQITLDGSIIEPLDIRSKQ